MKKLLLILLYFFSLAAAKAQNNSISGTVFNAADNQALKDVVVLIIQRNDSVLTSFARTNALGKFSFSLPRKGNYRIQCSYPGNLDFVDTFNLDSAEFKTLDTIQMLNKIQALKEIVINKFSNGIRLSGDTVEYLADFFKTNPGATVEDLLKRMPGITVNRNGEITAQGEKVKKILVDGEEFFPDDPTVATKYLRAEMIDKVQVYDQREDTTSKSDNDKVKTLNLTLKQDKKKGYFGKAEVGTNFDKYTNGGGFSGYFNKKLKAAAYAKKSNFEDASLGWQESQQFGGTASGGYNYEENYGYYYGGGTNFNDEMDSRGIPFNTSAGATFNNSWDSSKNKINASYRFANEGSNGKITNSSKYFLPDTSYSIHDTTVNRSTQDGNRANAALSLKTDSFNSLKITGTFAVNQGNSTSSLKSGTSASRLINYSNRDLQNKYNREQIEGKFEWNKSFRKKGKFLNNTFQIGYKPSTSEQSQQSSNTFFAEAGVVKKLYKIDQIKKSEVNTTTATYNFFYGNRFNKYYTWNTNYTFNFQKNNNLIQTFNRENGNIANMVDSLSNNYNYNQIKNNAGIGLNYSRKKWSYWVNTAIGYSNYFQTNKTRDTSTQIDFINFIPRGGLTYTWKKQSSIQLYYSGFTSAPSMNALQPLVNNADPFNQTAGNANLTQSFNHSINLNIHNYQTIKGKYFTAGFGADLPRNAFVTSTIVDTNAIRRTTTVNANGNYSLDGNMNFSIRAKKIPVSFSWELNAKKGRNISFTNNTRIATENLSATGQMDVDFYTDVFNISLSYSLNWNQSSNNISGSKKTEYIIQTPSYEIEINLPGNFMISQSGDFNMRPASAVFKKQNVYYLTAGLSKFFGKNRDVELEFYMNDLLNQNIGFTRNISTNLVSEELYTQLSRYWLVKLKWNFASAGGRQKND